jgi:threonine aldolase
VTPAGTVAVVLPAAPARDFGSDNRSGISPDALAGIVSANSAARASSYGDDPTTAAATDRLGALFGREVYVTWVPTGTAANVAAIGALLDGPGAAVVVADDAHIHVDEAGAVERAWGVPLVPVEAVEGKLTPDTVTAKLARLAANRPFSPVPSVLSLTNLSEIGRRYSIDELAAFADLARSHDMALHVDGARFANALVGDLALTSVFDAGVTTLAFGCAKNGQGPVEAVVTVDATVHARVVRAAKQLGWTMSKMRFATGGVAASLASGEFLANAAAANRSARRLADRLACVGVTPVVPVDGNLVFVRLPVAVAVALDAWCHVADWDGQGLVRLACSWDHTDDDVDTLADGVAALLATDSVPGP